MTVIAEKLVLTEIQEVEEPIDTGRLASFAEYNECGAVTSFLGNVRATEKGVPIKALEYEYHVDLAPRELRKIAEEALGTFDVRRVACVHRVGRVPVGEASVAIWIGADHRAAAFQACQYVIDQLKVRVPIWKSIAY
ncbi:MAG: molybdenum cofactor biosynthesis protein MoaE [Candidatus Sumerlaeaceae bacterium]|nr:molybdenum cofactor biosynthesis protein MoaE [Candidatus Sumerlaeaceae bacterium]